MADQKRITLDSGQVPQGSNIVDWTSGDRVTDIAANNNAQAFYFDQNKTQPVPAGFLKQNNFGIQLSPEDVYAGAIDPINLVMNKTLQEYTKNRLNGYYDENGNVNLPNSNISVYGYEQALKNPYLYDWFAVKTIQIHLLDVRYELTNVVYQYNVLSVEFNVTHLGNRNTTDKDVYPVFGVVGVVGYRNVSVDCSLVVQLDRYVTFLTHLTEEHTEWITYFHLLFRSLALFLFRWSNYRPRQYLRLQRRISLHRKTILYWSRWH